MLEILVTIIKKLFPSSASTTVLLVVVYGLTLPVVSVDPTLMGIVRKALAIFLILAFVIALCGGILELVGKFHDINHRNNPHNNNRPERGSIIDAEPPRFLPPSR